MEKSNVKVSIIVTVYNSEKYLYNCLNSLINQTLKEIEIICIDDCSTDSSYEILDYFKRKDDRIRLIKNPQNKGVGYSRNLGLKHVKGDYFQFLDSDDWLDADCVEKLYLQSQKYDTDMIMFKLINYDDYKGIFYKTEYYSMNSLNKYVNKVFNHEDLNNFLIFKIPNSPCNKFIKTSFVRDNNFTFPENLIHEDNPFFFKLFFSAKKIMISDNYFYNRRIRWGSITQTKDIHMMDMIEIVDLVLSFFIDCSLYEEYKKNVLNYMVKNLRMKFYNIPDVYKYDYFSLMKEKIYKYIFSYNLKNDFEELLYKPNKRFFDLVLSSKDYYEYKQNIQHKKDLHTSYDISIIIPVYNPKKTDINSSFKSILNQTYGFNKIEVIYVDDFSEYAEGITLIQELNDLYPNVRLLSLKENCGPGNARNVGIKNAKGKYIMFLDHDDYYLENACEILYNIIEREHVDIVGGNYINHTRDGKKVNWSKKNLSKYTKIFNYNENMNIFKVDPSIWTKIYSKNFLEFNHIEFKNYKSGEDLLFNQETLFKANGIVFVDETIVHYAIRKGESDKFSSLSTDNSKKMLLSLLSSYQESYNLFKEYNEKYVHITLNVLNYFVDKRLLNSDLSFNEFCDVFTDTDYLFKIFSNNKKTTKIKRNEELFLALSENDMPKAYQIYSTKKKV